MAELLSLLEFLELLSDSEQVRSDFTDNPDATLSEYGLDNLSPADVRDAILLAEDNRTVDWSEAYGAGSDPAASHWAGSHGANGAAFGSGATDPYPVASHVDTHEATLDPDPHEAAESLDPAPDPSETDDVAPVNAVDHPTADEILFEDHDLHLG